jgi:tight adherence protein C
LPPVEAIEAACRHRHSPLARALVEACARIRRGDGLEQAVSSVAGSFSDPGVAALCLALTSTHRLGTSAMEPVRVIARNCLAEQRSIRAERAAKTAPIVQLIVALGLVPAALMLVAAGILAVVGR